MNTQQARAMLADAEVIHSAETVNATLDRMAAEIRDRLSESYPLVLCVMTGGVVFCGQLLTRLDFPLDFDYLHASRYGANTTGHDKLTWRSGPWIDLKGRTVLVVDDILDEGLTLAAICERLKQMGAAEVFTAVFAEKETGRAKPLKADFVGLSVPDKFVFGFGMDICGAWRNLPAIYAKRGPAA